MYMQALSITPPAAGLSDRQRHRLETVNLIIKSLADCGLHVFGGDGLVGRVEAMRQGGFCFVPATPGARPVSVESAVRGSERLLPGFTGSYAEQRLLRCLVAYAREGRSTGAAMLAQALMSRGNQYFDQVEDSFTRILAEFRFTRAFSKPVMIDRKTGHMA